MRRINLSYLAPLAVFIFAVFCGFIIYRAAWFGIDKHFSLLAQSFLHNDLFLNPNNLPDGDYTDFNGKQYLFCLFWEKLFKEISPITPSLLHWIISNNAASAEGN